MIDGEAKDETRSNFYFISFHSFIMDYIYQTGYLGAQWADVQLTFFNDALKLHRSEYHLCNQADLTVVLAQSPYLAQRLGGPGSTVHLSFQDEAITSEAVVTCVHHLYSESPPTFKLTSGPALHLVNAANSRAVLVTALLFDIPQLVQHAYEIARESIPENVMDWVRWLQEDGYIGQPDEWEGGRYGEWSTRLKQDM